jgi:TorA maturation chaperone TorD
LLNTDGNGRSSLNKTKEITDFMLSEKGIEEIKSLFPETIETYMKLEDGFNELFKKKESLSLVPSERKKQDVKVENSDFSFDDFLEEHGMKEKKSPSLKR